MIFATATWTDFACGAKKSSAQDCWAQLQSAYFELHGLADSSGLNGTTANRVRSSIKRPLQECLRAGRHRGALLMDSWPADRQDELTLLDFAVLSNDAGLVNTMLDSGFTITGDAVVTNSHVETGGSSLHLAAYFSSDRAMEALLKSGAAADTLDTNGTTPLMLSSAKASSGVGVIRALLGAGANVNARDEFGRTSLYYAVQSGDPRKLKLLLDHGADTDIVYSDGRHIVTIATQLGRTEELRIIRAHEGSKQ